MVAKPEKEMEPELVEKGVAVFSAICGALLFMMLVTVLEETRPAWLEDLRAKV